MSVFGPYARYYDLLYRDKDYSGESAFVTGLIEKHAPGARRILELGCGTGLHACHLVQSGYDVHGLDLSSEMLETAQERRTQLPPDEADRLSFSVGNARTARLGRTFDAVIALFHVVSYQVTGEELEATFKTAAMHLKPGGVFVFDFWFAPAVLSDRPVVRVKRLMSDEIEVTRIAEPEMNERESFVDVNYLVFIRDKASGKIDEVRESHRMRYLTLDEIQSFSREAGLRVLDAREWMTGRQPGSDTWGVCAVAGK